MHVKVMNITLTLQCEYNKIFGKPYSFAYSHPSKCSAAFI